MGTLEEGDERQLKRLGLIYPGLDGLIELELDFETGTTRAAEGVDEDAIEDARDRDTPKESLIELILAKKKAAAQP